MRFQYFSIGIISILLCANPSFGQDTISVYSVKIDSLHQLIDSHPDEDEEKVRLLNEYARLCFYDLDFRTGLIATREARLLSEKLDFAGGKIMYYLTCVYPIILSFRISYKVETHYNGIGTVLGQFIPSFFFPILTL